MVYELFVIGSIAFYLLLTAFVLLSFWATEYEHQSGVTLFVVGAFLLAWLFLGDLGTRLTISLAWESLVYACLGLAWSFPRWFLLLHKAKQEYSVARTVHMAAEEITLPYEKDPVKPTPATWLRSWEFKRLHDKYGFGVTNDGKLEPPTFVYNRSRMVNWVLLWPFSMLWVLLRDVLYKATDYVIGCFGNLHQRLSDWMFRGVE